MNPHSEILHRHIIKWQRQCRKLVVGLEGYSGSGKTTITNELLARMPIVAVHMDDFQVSDAERQQLRTSGLPKGELFVEQYRFSLLKDLLRRFRSGAASAEYRLYDTATQQYRITIFDLNRPVLVVDGIWLSNTDRMRNEFDRIVFLDVSHDVADARRRSREGQEWPENAWEENHPDSYVRQFKMAFSDYMNKYEPHNHADLLLKM